MGVISDENKIVWLGIGLAGIWWILESLIHVVVFSQGNLIQDIIVLCAHEFWMRTFTFALIIIFSIYAQILLNRQKKIEYNVRKAHSELDQIFQTVPDGLCVIDKDYNILHINKKFLDLVDIGWDKTPGMKCYEVFSCPRCHTDSCPLTRVLKSEECIEDEVEKERRDGSSVTCILTATPFRNPEGEMIGMVKELKDITERKRMEDMILQSLKEKETLLTEIHHRVMNNMQVISSILNMEMKKVQEPVVRACFEKIKNRIRTIAFVHELACRPGDYSHISVGRLIKKITSNALAYQQSDHGTISVEIEAGDLTLDLNKSVPFGILLNEFVSNAVLHAFPGGRDGEITITFRVGKEKNILEFADNGVGLPAEIYFEDPQTTGMELIHGLAKQLDGKVEVLEGPGTRFRFEFPTE